jgi:hypothetical protein
MIARSAQVAVQAVMLALFGLGCGDGTGPGVTPHAIEIVSGDGQAAVPGEPAPEPLRVRVTGSDGQPLAGAAVHWSVATGQATLTPTQSTTDARGEAETRVTLGDANSVEVRATVQGVAPVTFSISVLDPCQIGSARPLSLESTMRGTLQERDCDLGDGRFRDLYGLTIGSQQAVMFRLTTPTFDPVLTLFARDRNGAYWDRGGAFDTVDARRSAVSRWILPIGEYMITPTSWDFGRTGAYDLLLSATSPLADGCEPIWVLRGVTTEQRLAPSDCTDPPGPFYRDVFHVVLWQGERVTLTQSSEAFAPRLRLLRWSGTLITEANGSATGTALIEFRSDETSLYIVHATSVAGERVGAYTLAVIEPGATSAASWSLARGRGGRLTARLANPYALQEL